MIVVRCRKIHFFFNAFCHSTGSGSIRIKGWNHSFSGYPSAAAKIAESFFPGLRIQRCSVRSAASRTFTRPIGRRCSVFVAMGFDFVKLLLRLVASWVVVTVLRCLNSIEYELLSFSLLSSLDLLSSIRRKSSLQQHQ